MFLVSDIQQYSSRNILDQRTTKNWFVFYADASMRIQEIAAFVCADKMPKVQGDKTLLKEGYLLTRYQDSKPRKGREPWERDAPWNMP